ncbi:hypothetical protein [Bacillus sp. PS06]|uniref:Nmad3 family putative nucleotide modification protein n=1 Tax=Bacillus sp. PS06 TaxID=2764176 RepID=UPI00178013E2|nr:hypothetical protein [Bacillus sp. PS06]MBD8069747.1 hypothetical protein [Bacillus sp. PS06]
MGRKVILSRKGFDETTGGKPSPIIDNKFISLPIPRADSDVFYKDLRLNQDENYLTVMKDMGIKFYSEAHLDPDLKSDVKESRDKNWRGLFGQSGKSQKRLMDEGVGEGDIFLYFGWFREAKKTKERWRYVPQAPNIHAIFGFLEVGKVIDISADDTLPSWAKYHPHFKDQHEYGDKFNSIYIATPKFTKCESKPGWGCFNYDKQLILTKEGAKNKSLWELPSCFQEERDQFYPKMDVWKILSNGTVELQPVGRGDQEMYISSNPDVVRWAEDLIKSCPIYT